MAISDQVSEGIGIPTRMLQTIQDEQNARLGDGLAVWNYPLAVVDTTATSLLNAVPNVLGYDNVVDSFVPAGATQYHRSKGLYDMVGNTAAMFAGVGVVMRGVQVSSRAGQLFQARFGEDAARAVFSTMQEVRDVDTIMAATRRLHAIEVGSRLRRNSPGLDLASSTSGTALAAYGRTFGDVQDWMRTARTTQAIKEGVAVEIALAATFNNSDFLFPDEMGSMAYLAFGGLGVGLNVGIEHILGRAAMRRGLRAASKSGERAAAAARAHAGGSLDVSDTLFNVVGEEWQGLVAALHGQRLVRELESATPALAGRPNSPLSYQALMATVRAEDAMISNLMNGHLSRMAKYQLNNNNTLRAGFGNMPAISGEYALAPAELAAMRLRVTNNEATTHGLASLENAQGNAKGQPGVVGRFEQIRRRMQDMENKLVSEIDLALEKNSPVDDIRKLQDELDALRAEFVPLKQFRAAVIERTGVANYSPDRQVPWEETAFAQRAQISQNNNGIRFTEGPDRTGQIALTNRGHLVLETRTDRFTKQTALDAGALSFSEASALSGLVARAAENKTWTYNFWKEFLADPDARFDQLPYQLLDAIADKRLTIPADLANMPKAAQVRAAVDIGYAASESLVKKFEAFRAMRADKGFTLEADLDPFDFEKLFNMRLTDERGMKNLLWDAFVAMDSQSLPASTVLKADGDLPNAIFDSAFQLGKGFRDSPIDLPGDESLFQESLRSLAVTLKDDPAQGIGALYHRLREPTDTDIQLAKLIRNRNALRNHAFTNEAPELVQNVARAAQEDEISFAGAQKGSEIFLDFTTRNNTLAQTTHAHALQDTLQHAHTQGQIAQTAIDAIKQEQLLPIAQLDRELFADTTGMGARVLAEYGQTYALVSRGVALVEEAYVPGLNAIDMTRPGAAHLLEILGPLRGAPDAGQPWHLFDVTIAATEGRYVPIQLSEQGAKRLNMSTAIQYKLLEAENFLRRQSGLHVKSKLNGHLPAPDFSRYEMRYISDPKTNRVVGYIKGRTVQEVETEVRRALDAHNAKLPPEQHLVPMKAEQIREYFEQTDQNFLSNLQDWSGYRQTGAGGGRNFDFRMSNPEELMAEHMIAMRNSFDDIKDRTLTGLYSQSFANTRRTAHINGDSGGVRGQKTHFSAAEQWENLLLARDRLPVDSHARRAHDWVDSLYNTTVGRMTDIMPWNMRAADAIINGTDNKLLARLTAPQRKHVEDAIANYAPFTHLVNRPDLKDVFKGRISADPYKLRRQLQSANRIAASFMLKHMNIAHPILNMMGLAVTLPAVRDQMIRRTGETAERFAERLGYLADYIDPERGFATVSPIKAFLEGWHMVFNDPAAYKFAAQRGYLSANMLEELNKLNNYGQRNTADILEDFIGMTDIYNRVINFGMKNRGATPSAPSLSERSETFSRAVAHMAGLALIRQSGREGLSEAAQHAFAHKFSNLNIADFAPNIRGEAFRGSAGIPFGLFQSYSINIYQRLFRYIQDGNKRSLAIQAMTQAGIFGMAGLPGWDQLNALYFNGSNMQADERGATSLNERIHQNLGKGMGDLLMSGSVSSLPKLLGADTGLNLYSSGDLNFQAPVIPPAISLAMQTGEGLREGVKRTSEELSNAVNGRGFDTARIGEVIANYGPSRGFRSMADLAIGERIDRRGNLILDDTRSGMGLLSRLIGVRTMNEMQVSAALWENSQAQSQRVADMARVRSRMLRGFRDGSLDEETALRFLDSYISAGGREDQWPRWLNYTAEMGTKTRAERALDRVVGQLGEVYGHDYASVMRLRAAGVEFNALLNPEAGTPPE